MEHKEIIIMGGGIAGISCALKLREAGRSFIMITERLGGRIYYSDEEKVNFGAYFYMSNYRHVKKVLKKGTHLNKASALYHNSADDYYTLFRLKTLRQFPQLVRFAKTMIIFKLHFEKYKKNCEVMPVREALAADPYMHDLFYRSALSFIDEKGFRDVHDDFFSKFSYACTAVSTDKVNALDYCTLSLGLLLPLHRFIFDNRGLALQFKNELVIDTVVEVKMKGKGYTVKTKSGKTYSSDYVVAATPGSVTQKLLHLPFIRNSYMLQSWHVEGTLKKKYIKYGMNLFGEGSKIIAIARQDDGSYLVFAATTDNQCLNDYFENFKMLGSVIWEKALYTEGKTLVEEHAAEFGENLYISGEHNCVGMEPSAISGIYAANAIIQSTRSGE